MPQKKSLSSIESGCVPGASRVWYFTCSDKSTWFVLSCKQYRHVRVSTHSDALLHTICFLSLIYFMAWDEGLPYISDTKNKRKNYCSSGFVQLRQLALGCESSCLKSTHDAYENTWKCGELKPFFSPSPGR